MIIFILNQFSNSVSIYQEMLAFKESEKVKKNNLFLWLPIIYVYDGFIDNLSMQQIFEYIIW